MIRSVLLVVISVSLTLVWTHNSRRKEVWDMAVVYATLIVKGLKTIDQVPAKIKNQVQEILDALEV